MKYRTGNDHVSLFNIGPGLSVNGMTTLSMENNGNLFVDSVQKVSVYVNGSRVKLEEADHGLLHYWVPYVKAKHKGVNTGVTLLAPKDSRGFICNLRFAAEKAARVRVVREFDYRSLNLCINRSYALDAKARFAHDEWFRQELIDIYMGKPALCIAFGADRECRVERKGGRLAFEYEFNLCDAAELNLYTAIGMEEMAAMSVNVEFMRRGFGGYFDATIAWLKARTREFENGSLTKAYNTNLFFNYFYASGITIDTQETVCVTSRSPEYYVSAAYWDRDALLWSFPAVMTADMDRAREILLYVFGVQGGNFGVHSRFINGNTLECGFELDELAAPFIALASFLKAGGDRDILEEPCIKRGLLRAGGLFDSWYDGQTGLYRTELRPSDDMIKYPFNIYDNVLVWKAFLSIADVSGRNAAGGFKRRAAALKKAIMARSVMREEGMFAYETDGRGGFAAYEEPPGSLKLLHHYGFIDGRNRGIYEKTLEWIYSGRNRHFYTGTAVTESGCDHAPHPWTLSACNSLLTPGREKYGVDFFRGSAMDDGVACESVKAQDGTPATGMAFATCAGFVAYSIHKYYTGKVKGKSKKP